MIGDNSRIIVMILIIWNNCLPLVFLLEQSLYLSIALLAYTKLIIVGIPIIIPKITTLRCHPEASFPKKSAPSIGPKNINK